MNHKTDCDYYRYGECTLFHKDCEYKCVFYKNDED